MNWFLMGLKRYTDFSGRSRRSEYWFFFLFYVIIVLALAFIESAFSSGKKGEVGILSSLFMLIMLLPSLALGVRRLHDVGKSGWWLLISIVPIIGLVLLYFACLDGEPGTNRFGANPKGIAALPATAPS